MARWILGIGAALAATGLAAPVAAQAVDGDVRCLLASNVFIQRDKDPARKQLAMAAQAFYLGRLDARISNEQLKTAVQAQARTMTIGSLPATMDGCVKHMAQKGLALRDISGPPGAPPPAAPKKPK